MGGTDPVIQEGCGIFPYKTSDYIFFSCDMHKVTQTDQLERNEFHKRTDSIWDRFVFRRARQANFSGSVIGGNKTATVLVQKPTYEQKVFSCAQGNNNWTLL